MLIKLLLTFAYLSLVSIGGVASSFPEMERLVVQTHHWMDYDTLVELYSLGQLVPGPNVFYAFLVGNHLAGWAGGFVSLIGLVAPPCLLMAGIAGLAGSKNPPSWMEQFFVAVRPVTIGLRLAAAWTLGQSFGIYDVVIFAVAVFLALWKSLNPTCIVLLAVLCGLGVSLI